MPQDLTNLAQAVDSALTVQQLELAETRSRQLVAVVTQSATGTGDIDETFGLDRRFRLVFIRCHFVGTDGTAPFVISIDSASGSAYDARLFTVTKGGTEEDVHLRIAGGDTAEPSAWTFRASDTIRITWSNPDSGNITWGLEVGLAVAS